MPIDQFPNNIESRNPRKSYVEDVFERLPEIEAGVDLTRAYPTLLSGPKDSKVKLSTEDRLGREGWDSKDLVGLRKGSLIPNRDGNIYEVVAVDNKNKTLKIKDKDDQAYEGAIIATPRVMRAHEYTYKISSGPGHSKKIKVMDTVFRNKDLRTTEFINTILKAIPSNCTQVFDELQIHVQYTRSGVFKVEPSLTSEKNIINLYVNPDLQYTEGDYPTKDAIQTLYHELGHAIVKFLKGSVHPGKKWKQSMDQDGNDISEYAAKTRYPKKQKSDEPDHGEIEDIAEAFRFYFATDSANVPQAQPLRNISSSRFQRLDKVMDELEVRQKQNALSRLLTKPANSLEK